MTRPDPRAALRAAPTLTAARQILGWRLVREGPEPGEHRVGRIVEVEAYVGEADQASHARFGRTARNAVMYGPSGRAYVYLVYGMHDCLNIVTGPDGTPEALLVRAIEPLEGLDRMRAARTRRVGERQRAPRPVSTGPDQRLASGPGLVCAAFDLDRSLTGADLLDPGSIVRLEPPPADDPAPRVVTGPRVGIAYAGEPWTSKPWRFALAGNRSVSRPPLG